MLAAALLDSTRLDSNLLQLINAHSNIKEEEEEEEEKE